MLRPKVRVRALMVLIAVIALGIWGEQMRRRRAYCLAKSRVHRSKLFKISGFHIYFSSPLPTPEREEEWRRTYPHAAWHLKLSDAYLHCASHPWEPVPQEPPEPSVFPDLPGQ